jgi:hypothetical protein
MGNQPSSSRSQEDNDRFWREYEEADRKEKEEAAAAAAAAARKAEEDRRRQAEEMRRREEEEAERIRANAPFRKPIGPKLALSLIPNQYVDNMTINIPPGLSSSTVILTRHIINKEDVDATPKPPKNPVQQPGIYAGTTNEAAATLNYLVPEDPKINIGGMGFTGTTAFISLSPNKDYPEVLVKGRPRQTLNLTEYAKVIEEQNSEGTANIAKYKAAQLESQTPKVEQKTILWNPSETKGQNGAVAINYKTHGALTKVFLKPTIPFEIRYDPVPLLPSIDAPAPAPK